MIAIVEAGGVKLGFEKAASSKGVVRTSPLEPKKLNFYCTLGLGGGFKRHGYAAEFAIYNIDNQLFKRGAAAVKSINKNNGYNNKNFEFCLKISKNGWFFRKISKDFEEISNYFERISKETMCDHAIFEGR